MARILALLAAAALVVGALALRGALDSDTVVLDVPGSSGGAVALTCATELRAACEAVAAVEARVTLTVEDAAATAARVAGDPAVGASPVEVWLVPQPWPEIAAVLGGRGTPIPEVSEPLARSPLVIIAFADRAEALQAECGAIPDWSCVGQHAGATWRDIGLDVNGTVRPGVADPRRSAVGLLLLGHAVSTHVGRTDVSLRDLDDDATASWFARLVRATRADAPVSPLTDMLLVGAANVDLAGTVQAEVLAAPDRPDRVLTTVVDDPPATADVVAATYDGDGLDAELADALVAALVDARWRPADDPALPSTSGLPSAGFLVAVQQRQQEVR